METARRKRGGRKKITDLFQILGLASIPAGVFVVYTHHLPRFVFRDQEEQLFPCDLILHGLVCFFCTYFGDGVLFQRHHSYGKNGERCTGEENKSAAVLEGRLRACFTRHSETSALSRREQSNQRFWGLQTVSLCLLKYLCYAMQVQASICGLRSSG